MAYAAKGGAGHSLIASADDWKIGRTSHVAFVADGPRYRFFVDGRLWRHGELGNPPAASRRAFEVGGSQLLKGFFQGALDELRISRVARYHDDFSPAERHEPDNDTVALYHFDEGKGARLVDSSGRNLHGKIIGAVWAPEPESKD